MTKRQLTEKNIVLASHNKGKLVELQTMLKPYGITVQLAGDLGVPEPEENGNSFSENAIIKALAVSKATNLVALADDSGLCVHALNNRPGIYSARYADAKTKGFNHAMTCINQELGNSVDRTAHFACVLALAWPDGHTETFEGQVQGEIIYPPQGDKGFGYDPIFKPTGYDDTFGVLSAEIKNKISHRSQAFQLFITQMLT